MKQPSPLRSPFPPRYLPRSLLACGALLVACGSEPLRPDTDVSLALASRHAWAGGTLDLYSAAFHDARALPVVRLDTVPLAATRVNDTTLRVTIPGSYAGAYLVSASIDGRFLTGPAVEVAGYLGSRPLGEQLTSFHYTRMMPSSRPRILSAQNGEVAIVDLADGTVNRLDMPLSALRDAGPGFQPGTYLTMDSVGRFVLYAVGDRATPIDTIIVAANRLADPLVSSLLGPDLAFVGLSKYFALATADSSTYWRGAYPGPLVFSPLRDRATYVSVCDDPNAYDAFPGGHPVFSTPGGMIAYTIPPRNVVAIDFDPSSAVLGVATGRALCFDGYQPQWRLLRYRASDGMALDSLDLPRDPLGIAFDPVRPYLYVALGTPYYYPSDSLPLSILVLDAATLAQVGEMRTSILMDRTDQDVLDFGFGADNMLYVIEGLSPVIARFSLPPP